MRRGAESRTSQPLLSCLLPWEEARTHHQKKKTKSIKQNFRQEQMRQEEKEDEEGWRKRWRGEREMKWKWWEGLPLQAENISTSTAPTQPWVPSARFLIALLFMCLSTGEVECALRQCEETPLHSVTHTQCTVTRSPVSWGGWCYFLESFLVSSNVLPYRLVHMQSKGVCVCVCVCVFARIQTHMQQTVLVSENWKKIKK